MCLWPYRFFLPDSPANAKFLTPEEKRLAVLRIKVNQTGVENKHFKISQLVPLFGVHAWAIFMLIAQILRDDSRSKDMAILVAHCAEVCLHCHFRGSVLICVLQSSP